MIGYVYLRLIWALVQAWRAPHLEPLAAVSTPLTIFPNDLDGNLHLNNGRYLTLMDIGRFDYTCRTGLLKLMLSKRWYPVLAGVIIRYRKPFNVFDRIELKTKVIWWDNRWLYLEQRFEKEGTLHAKAFVKAVFKHGKRSLPSDELLTAMGLKDLTAPPLPPAIAHWQMADAALKE